MTQTQRMTAAKRATISRGATIMPSGRTTTLQMKMQKLAAVAAVVGGQRGEEGVVVVVAVVEGEGRDKDSGNVQYSIIHKYHLLV